ncbi:MAG: hypothetical protein ACRCX2_18560 [Paraclostridium sp.]
MATNNSYRQYQTMVDSSGILSTENLGWENTKISVTNITNALKTPGSSESLTLSLTAYPTAGISFKEVKAAAGVTKTVADLATNGIIFANQPLTQYPVISQATVAVAAQTITVTLPASQSLPVGGWVVLSAFNDGAKSLRVFQGEPLAVLKKNGNDYVLGTVVPTAMTVSSGKCDVTFIGMILPTQAAHPFLVKSRSGSVVTITASISEPYYVISKTATELTNYCFVLSANSLVSRGKNAERYVFEVMSISTDGTGTIVINDPDRILNETFVPTLGTDRFVLEGKIGKKVGLDARRIYFTGLAPGDSYVVESSQ